MSKVEMIMLGLKTFYICSQSSIDSWKLQLERSFQLDAVHVCIMKAMSSTQVEMVQLALQLIKLDYFPYEALARVCGHCNCTIVVPEFKSNDSHASTVIVPFDKDPYLLARVEDAVDKVLNGKTREEIKEITVQDVLQMFEYKLAISRNQELYLLNQARTAADEVTYLSHQNALLEAKIIGFRDESLKFNLTKKR